MTSGEDERPDVQFKLRGVTADYPGHQVALALVDNYRGILVAVGSGVVVAPGLAMTASHVIDGCFRYREQIDGYKRSDSALSLTAVQSYDDKVFMWTVDFIYGSILSDIAFLRFVRPNWWGDGPGQVKPAFARLNLNPPAPGDRVRVFGFPNSEMQDGILNIYPAECECRVLTVEARTGEPKWNRPLAHMQLEGEIEHGMSGGPCFDEHWNVIGVNSSGWSGVSLATVALLWPAMKIEIDLYKTGPFPAIELFRSGDNAALGYQRIYITSDGSARFSRVDPESLKPTTYFGATESLSGAIDHAGAAAQESLAELRDTLAKAQSGIEPINSNKIVRLARYYFWDLEAALQLSILLASRQLGLVITEPPTWDQLSQNWKAQRPGGDVMDGLAMLDFDWKGVDLFDTRSYAAFSRSGVLGIQCMQGVKDGLPVGPIMAVSLEPPCRNGCPQLFLPDGLDRFMDASRRFVQRLLQLCQPAPGQKKGPAGA
jgi:hypothetical protein